MFNFENKKSTMDSAKKFLLGFISGIASGAAVGLLLAPDKGEQTRKIIVEKIDELAQKGKEIYDSKKKVGDEGEE